MNVYVRCDQYQRKSEQIANTIDEDADEQLHLDIAHIRNYQNASYSNLNLDICFKVISNREMAKRV